VVPSAARVLDMQDVHALRKKRQATVEAAERALRLPHTRDVASAAATATATAITTVHDAPDTARVLCGAAAPGDGIVAASLTAVPDARDKDLCRELGWGEKRLIVSTHNIPRASPHG